MWYQEQTFKRTRARIACTYCHDRKVRCDASTLGVPCTNCRLDGYGCQEFPSRRLKKITQPLNESVAGNIALPNYIKSPAPQLSEDDILYIQTKGIFNLPSSGARDQLWKAYFLLVHPNFPILDREQVLQSYTSPNDNSKISLLLLYCVMSTAQLFYHTKYGQPIVSENSQTMFEKARILYDLNWETDRMTVLQSVLLMTHFPGWRDERRGPYQWLVNAVSLAYQLNLHRSFADSALYSRQRTLRKQIWWCLYIRDRTMSLDLGTPWIISEQDHEVPMLTTGDVELAPLLPSFNARNAALAEQSLTRQRLLGIILIAKTQLAVLLSRLVPIPMTNWHLQQGENNNCSTQSVLSAPALSELDQIDKILDLWDSDLLEEIIHVQNILCSSEYADKRDEMSCFHCKALLVFYRIVRHHSASLRWRVCTWTFESPPKTTRARLLETTVLLVHEIEELTIQKATHYTQLSGLSVARPLLLWTILSQDYPDCSPLLQCKDIRVLLERLVSFDPWAIRTLSHPVFSTGSSQPQVSNVNSNTFQSTPNDIDIALEVCDWEGANSMFSTLDSPTH